MRKTILFATLFLLIAAPLLVTATAKKPQPETTYTVTFESHIKGTVDLFYRDRGGKLDLYGRVSLTFVGSVWNYEDFNWVGDHVGNMRIFISKETNEVLNLIYDFDSQSFPNGYSYPLYSLRGPNSEGTYDVFEISIERKGKKGALSLVNIYITSLPLVFQVIEVT